MIDEILKVAGSFDWISPLKAFTQDFLNGPVADFGIPSQAGWAGRDIKRLLNHHGIKVWGLMLTTNGDMLMFTVREAQAKWAYYVLKRAGVPILYAPDFAVQRPSSQDQIHIDTKDPVEQILRALENATDKY